MAQLEPTESDIQRLKEYIELLKEAQPLHAEHIKQIRVIDYLQSKIKSDADQE